TGAVNMVTFRSDGFSGSNTDVAGFLASLQQTLPVEQLKTHAAVVVGAGGAARAVVLALVKTGFSEIRLVNRTRATAADVERMFAGKSDCRVLEWGEWTKALPGARLLVNTTSLGMKGNPPLELPLEALPSKAAVADIVYNPVETSLLRQARAAGHQTMDGLGMLMHQAVPAFAAWFGVRPAVTPALRSYLLKALGIA